MSMASSPRPAQPMALPAAAVQSHCRVSPQMSASAMFGCSRCPWSSPAITAAVTSSNVIHRRIADLGVTDVLGHEILHQLAGDALEIGRPSQAAIDLLKGCQELQEGLEIERPFDLFQVPERQIHTMLASQIEDGKRTNRPLQMQVQLGLRQPRQRVRHSRQCKPELDPAA